MVKLNLVTGFLDSYLDIKNIKDGSYNGLQVQGKKEVRKIVFAVTAGMQTFKKAKETNADMIVVHHGLFWKGVSPNLIDYNFDRIKFLVENKISLYASHLPLDKHQDIGNNAQLLKILDFKKDREFGLYEGNYISFTGKTSKPKTVKEIENILQNNIGATCKTLPFGKKEIKTMAVCSGGGGIAQLSEAIDLGVDFYLTGDSTEFYHIAKDARINVICAGHHATETVGVKNLSKVVYEKFDIETLFIDIPTML
ncbi:Nif3-like dinuclear metal center hexameric protein [Candidatus Dependentiae bacterium]